MGQQSSGAMERCRTSGGRGVYSLPARRQARRKMRRWVSTPVGRSNAKGLQEGVASTHILREGKQRDVGWGGSALQRGDGTLQDLVGGRGAHAKGGVAVDVAAVKRDRASVDVDATALRAQRKGQHSSGAMERYGTSGGGGVYSLQPAGACNRAHRGTVSTPAGRWNVTGLDGRAHNSHCRHDCRRCRSCRM